MNRFIADTDRLSAAHRRRELQTELGDTHTHLPLNLSVLEPREYI